MGPGWGGDGGVGGGGAGWVMLWPCAGSSTWRSPAERGTAGGAVVGPWGTIRVLLLFLISALFIFTVLLCPSHFEK